MYDVIVIGGGPAGIMASITASKRGFRVLLLEKNETLGKKLLLTGGGRCNLTNLKTVNDFIDELPVNNKFLYSTLTSYGPKEIYDYFNELGVKLKVENNDRVFPITNKASTILDALINELTKYKVTIKYSTEVTDIKTIDSIKIITTASNNVYKAPNIIIACGGKSYPSTGSNGSSYHFAKELNQPLIKTYPAEVALTLKTLLPLAGITIENAVVIIGNIKKEGAILMTHKGLSGPAILSISEYAHHAIHADGNCTISIDLLPNIDNLMFLINNYNQKYEVKTLLREYLPKRLVDYIMAITKISGDKKLATISNVERNTIVNTVKNLTLEIKDTGSIDQAFVTGGGVDTKCVNSKTMESTINKGIYFIGEALDIHGPTGGYNITLALSSGYTAGYSIKA
mgnify:CR=1 FL=1